MNQRNGHVRTCIIFGSSHSECQVAAQRFRTTRQGSTAGVFEITQQIADDMFHQHIPHGKPNSDVIRRWKIGRDINQRSRNMLIIDFGTDMTGDCDALYEAPFEYVRANVKPKRIENRMRRRAERWCLHG